VIGGSNQRNWLRTLDALEAQHLADDPRFRENSDRMAHLKELEEALAPYFAQRTSQDWLARFEALGVPAGPVYDVLEMQADPQVQARQMVVEVDHATAGPVKTLGLPVKFSDTPGAVLTSAPVYGQHTRQVLREHGFSAAEIEALRAEAAIVIADG